MRVYTGLNKSLTINGLDNVSPNGDNDYSVIKYDYDFYGNKTSYTDAIGNQQIFNYNQFNGRLLSKEQHYIDDNNAYQQDYKISYEYDSSGNVTEVEGVKAGAATLTKTFTYDLTGKVLTATDENTTITYTYDEVGNCTKIAYTLNSIYYEIEYTYNAKNLVSSCKIYTKVGTNNRVLQSQRDSLYTSRGYLFYTDYTDSENLIVFETYYDNNGNIETETNTSQLNEILTYYKFYEYNYINLPVKISDQYWGEYASAFETKWQENSTYSADGNLTGKTECTYNNSDETSRKITEYEYDNLNRLTQESFSDGSIFDWVKNYSFDDYNNISGAAYTDNNVTSNSSTTTYSYDKANKITEQKEVLANNTVKYDYKFSYDNSGNLASKVNANNNAVLQEFTYDSMNRTKSITTYGTTSVTADFAYNANDQRLTKTVGNKTITSIWNGGDIAVDLTDVNGTTTSKSKYLKVNTQVGVLKDGVTYYYSMNSKNDVVNEISSNNYSNYYANNTYSPQTFTHQYDGYGNKSGDTAVSAYGYRGYYTDSETGLIYLSSRYYDPSTQRFTQEDTYQDDNLQENYYGYCSANPVMYSDPTGHFAESYPNKNIDKNSKDTANIKIIQHNLNYQFNYYFLSESGTFDAYTENAIRVWQTQHDLTSNGIVDKATWESLSCVSPLISSSGYDFIKRCEGTFLYKVNSANTIGWGHVRLPGETFTTITLAEGNALLKKDVTTRFQPIFKSFLKTNKIYLNQQQYDACITDCYQKGPNIWGFTGGMATMLKNRNYTYAVVEKAFLSGLTSKNRGSNPGLYSRRMAEAHLFFYRNYPSTIY